MGKVGIPLQKLYYTRSSPFKQPTRNLVNGHHLVLYMSHIIAIGNQFIPATTGKIQAKLSQPVVHPKLKMPGFCGHIELEIGSHFFNGEMIGVGEI